MPRFGNSSRERLDTCHKDLQLIAEEAIKYIDFSVTEGRRSDAKQFQYYQEGKSKLDGFNKKSKHQVTEEDSYSKAIDIAPYPIDYSDKLKARARFYMLAGYMFMASEMLYSQGKIAHKIRWGGDWDSDKNFEDQSFDDLPHFELV